MSYHALRTHVFVFARPYHTLPTYVFGSVWLVWYITSCILHDNTRTPAYVCICICMLHMVHHIMYIARQHKDTSIQLVAPVHVTYACMYTQGHPLRSQGPAQKRKDTRIELVVLVHGGRRDVIRPAPHVDLSHTAHCAVKSPVAHALVESASPREPVFRGMAPALRLARALA